MVLFLQIDGNSKFSPANLERDTFSAYVPGVVLSPSDLLKITVCVSK